MDFQKITEGHVVQIFRNGQCIGQRFYAGDSCQYFVPSGRLIDPPEYRYQPYDMMQPKDRRRI